MHSVSISSSLSLSMESGLLSRSMVMPKQVRDLVCRECLSMFMGRPNSVNTADSLSK